MRKITVGILGVAALAASAAILKVPRAQARTSQEDDSRAVPAGERVASQISLERMRELGI